MLLFEPPPTQGDLHFRVLGIPVRVHPMFWLITLMFGISGGGEPTPPIEFIIWGGVVFVSILIHELGHALVQRYYGGHPRITLYAFGGLAACDDCDRRPSSQIAISLAGPAAGFLFALLVMASVQLSGHALGFAGPGGAVVGPQVTNPDGLVFFGSAIYWEAFPTEAANTLLRDLLWVNIGWGLINLLPVYPLDGGRVSLELCTLAHPRRGVVVSLWISIVTAVAMAAFAFKEWGSWYTALMFGYLAYSNYQTLQAYQTSRG